MGLAACRTRVNATTDRYTFVVFAKLAGSAVAIASATVETLAILRAVLIILASVPTIAPVDAGEL
jgi:hypothetical protein